MAVYGAPPKIEALLGSKSFFYFPILAAVGRLGPARCQWLGGGGGNKGASSYKSTPTCWALDGKRATLAELRGAADADGRQTKG